MSNQFNTYTDNQKKEIKKALYLVFSENLVSFSFTKKDGTNRPSFGCLDSDTIEKNGGTQKTNTDENAPKKEMPLNLFKYFDTEKKAWRSFNIDTLVEIMNIPADDFFKEALNG